MSIYYQNVRSLNNKIDDFYSSASQCEFDLICITETWLKPNVCNSEFLCGEYNVFRCDRDLNKVNVSRGGGTLIAIKDKFTVTEINFNHIKGIVGCVDVVGCKIFLGNIFISVIILVYIPPSISTEDFVTFVDLLSNVINVYDSNVLILGDFNTPNLYGNINDKKSSQLLSFANLCNMVQYNNVKNSFNRILDLVYANFNCNVLHDHCPMVQVDEYHPALNIFLGFNLQNLSNFEINSKNIQYNFRKANFPLLYNSILGINWTFIEDISNVDLACDEFYNTINEIFGKCIPVKTNCKRKLNYPPWFNKTIISNIHKKMHYHKKYKRTKRLIYLELFKNTRTMLKKQISDSYKHYIFETENNINHNPNQFWSFIQSKKGVSRIPNNVYYNNTYYDKPLDIVNKYCEYFSNVYKKSNINYFDKGVPSHYNISIDPITEADILSASKKLNNKFTSGIDNIPSFLGKDCAMALAKPLVFLFNLIISSKQFPKTWKISKIIPVLKSGDPSNIANYRPISILCNFSKLFESIIYKKIYYKIKNIISINQHGFVEKRSTVTNLAVFTQFASDVLDSHGQLDVIYTDFRKAFDQIDHYVLLTKLASFGFSDDLVSVFSSYLINRSQFVFYNGFGSQFFVPTSGVPQGSNLGPLLFLIFINDLPECIKSKNLLFADDLKIFGKINSTKDCYDLQNDLESISRWCTKNCLHLNTDKCKTMTFSKKKNIITFEYGIDNCKLVRVSAFKDLGVEFDPGLSFTAHIEKTINSSFRSLGFLIRNTRTFKNERTFKTLYFAFVRSKLEYASLIWSPIYEAHKMGLETVQRKFLKLLHFKIYGNYPVQGFDHALLLAIFNVNSLDLRRIIISVTFLYNIVHANVDCTILLDRLNFNIPRKNSRNQITFRNHRANTNIGKKSPIYYMCQNFNMISVNCDINFNTLSFIIQSVLECCSS